MSNVRKLKDELAKDRELWNRGKDLQRLRESIGWSALQELLENGIYNRINKLSHIECSHVETDRLRIQIQVLQEILRIATVTDDNLERLARRIEFTQTQIDKLESFGLIEQEQS